MPEHLPPPLQDLVRTALTPGEEIWWAGQPSPWRRSTANIFMSLLLLAWGIIGAAVASYAVSEGWQWWTENGVAALLPASPGWSDFLDFLSRLGRFGLILVIAGMFLGTGVAGGIVSVTQTIGAFAETKRTVYAVTSRRALALSPQSRQETGPDQMPFVEKMAGKGVFFNFEIQKDSDGDEYFRLTGFDCLRDTAAAESALLKLLRNANTQPIDIENASQYEAAIHSELQQGESVRWLGRPARRKWWRLTAADLAAALVTGMILLIFAALAFIGLALSFSFGDSSSPRRRTRRTAYAVTGRRAMIVVAPGHVISFLPGQTGAITTEIRPDGSGKGQSLGSVYFHRPAVKDHERDYWCGFEDLADLDGALRALDALRRGG